MMASGTDIVRVARDQIGDPYAFGAEGPAAFDCSGLVEWAYRQFGIKVPRTTRQMTASGSPLIPIERSQARPGDLVFSNWIGKPSSHVAILTERGTVIEAPQPGQTVRETSLGPTYLRHVDAYRRVPGLSDSGAALAGFEAGLNVVPGIGGALSNVVGAVRGVAGGGPVGDTLSMIGTTLGGMVEGVQEMGRLASLVAHLFAPGAILRGVLFFLGWILILIGIWFLA